MFLATSLIFAAAGAPPLVQPVKPWVVDYAEARCSASRVYGGEEPVTLAFRPAPSGSVVRIALARLGRSSGTYHFPVKVNAAPGDERTTALRFTSRDKKVELVWINVERAGLDALAAAGEIAIEGRGIDERYALPGFAAVVKALDTCNADLRAHWNADEAGAARLTRPPAALKPLASYVTDDDYPSQALQEGATGKTRVTLMIDADGKAQECMVEATSGIASLDVMACGIFLERASFRPALDAEGTPARGVLTTQITWRID